MSQPIWRAEIAGAPRTKKTSQRLIRAGGRYRVIPSKQHEVWFRGAMLQAKAARSHVCPIDYPVACRAAIYRDRAVGDLLNFLQALADLLERAGIVTNDRLIVDWSGSVLLKDAGAPRILVELREANDGKGDPHGSQG